MDEKKYELLKSKFLKVYPNVPEPLRREIIVIVGNEPFTWQTAKAEIIQNTKNAKAILEHLSQMEVIENA